MGNDFEQISLCSVAIYVSLMNLNYLIKSSAHWKYIFFGFLMVGFWEFFIYSKYKCFIKFITCKCSLPFCSLVFAFLTVSFEEKKKLLKFINTIYLTTL